MTELQETRKPKGQAIYAGTTLPSLVTYTGSGQDWQLGPSRQGPDCRGESESVNLIASCRRLEVLYMGNVEVSGNDCPRY